MTVVPYKLQASWFLLMLALQKLFELRASHVLLSKRQGKRKKKSTPFYQKIQWYIFRRKNKQRNMKKCYIFYKWLDIFLYFNLFCKNRGFGQQAAALLERELGYGVTRGLPTLVFQFSANQCTMLTFKFAY